MYNKYWMYEFKQKGINVNLVSNVNRSKHNRQIIHQVQEKLKSNQLSSQ